MDFQNLFNKEKSQIIDMVMFFDRRYLIGMEGVTGGRLKVTVLFKVSQFRKDSPVESLHVLSVCERMRERKRKREIMLICHCYK